MSLLFIYFILFYFSFSFFFFWGPHVLYYMIQDVSCWASSFSLALVFRYLLVCITSSPLCLT